MIARTEILSASNQGLVEGYEQAGVSEIEWFPALDDKSCEICDSQDGFVTSTDNRNMLPAHPNCRCCWLPVIKD
jgi:SPP1 gp7 family putative phage head morphogenesis protein